ncbi:hypothetical protein NQZ68_014437 [Dissostichus eleginoides]|nr:hypothetical protein NQZ68_014437 [Dissostichus eleginoides]
MGVQQSADSSEGRCMIPQYGTGMIYKYPAKDEEHPLFRRSEVTFSKALTSWQGNTPANDAFSA